MLIPYPIPYQYRKGQYLDILKMKGKAEEKEKCTMKTRGVTCADRLKRWSYPVKGYTTIRVSWCVLCQQCFGRKEETGWNITFPYKLSNLSFSSPLPVLCFYISISSKFWYTKKRIALMNCIFLGKEQTDRKTYM